MTQVGMTTKQTAETTVDDAVERVLSMLRARLTSALQNGQRVRMDGSDHARGRVPWGVAATSPLEELLSCVEPDGSFELHIRIEPKRR